MLVIGTSNESAIDYDVTIPGSLGWIQTVIETTVYNFCITVIHPGLLSCMALLIFTTPNGLQTTWVTGTGCTAGFTYTVRVATFTVVYGIDSAAASTKPAPFG